MIPDLTPRTTAGAVVKKTPAGGWHLSIPSGPKGRYRLAQLDDYAQRPRPKFPWNPPVYMKLEARACALNPPGTWGFGLWNDPFSLSLGLGGASRRLPALPNAAWFFFASPPNHLSLREDLPARGPLAATFVSPELPPLFLALGVPLLPLFALPPAARLLRQLARRFIQQDAAQLKLNDITPTAGTPTGWHTYELTWTQDEITFSVDGDTSLETGVVPLPPMGLVLWVDNQYAALPPDGRLRFGNLPNPEPAWIEIQNLEIRPPRN